jgi:hypothetical protein
MSNCIQAAQANQTALQQQLESMQARLDNELKATRDAEALNEARCACCCVVCLCQSLASVVCLCRSIDGFLLRYSDFLTSFPSLDFSGPAGRAEADAIRTRRRSY